MEIKRICVAGCGLMGRQIGLHAAINGYTTYLTDNDPMRLAEAAQWADDYLSGRINKNRMNQEQVDATKSRFHFSEYLKDASENADLVIEAIIEIEENKKAFFKELDNYVREDTIIVTNSSRMVSSLFKDCVRNPSRLANMHYFNPALVMELVEIVQGEHCNIKTVETLMDFCRKIKKTPIWLRKEIDGFVANRILRAIGTEAFSLIEQGICSPQDIDIAQELGLGHPMGYFRLMDLTGIDLTFLQRKRTYEQEGIKPLGYDFLEEKYEKGEWGRKTGKGWYDY